MAVERAEERDAVGGCDGGGWEIWARADVRVWDGDSVEREQEGTGRIPFELCGLEGARG